nr:MAG TPA: hypothetical protein [Caudoviricetes sp.]
MMKNKEDLFIYTLGLALSLSVTLVISKLFGTQISWLATMVPLLIYVLIISILILIGSIAGIVTSDGKQKRGLFNLKDILGFSVDDVNFDVKSLY